MREGILDALARGERVVSDGAIGTQLQARGIPSGTISELWNAERPDVVLAIHRAYLEAGAQIATTNTFGGNRVRMAEAGLADRLTELNRRGVELAREAVGDSAWIGGSIGPTGRLMAPYGDLTPSEAEDAYVEQVRALVVAGVDLFLIETQHDAEEASLIIRTVRAQSDLPICCTFSFDVRGRTMMGLCAAEAARRAEAAGADIVGANCGEGLAAVTAAITQMVGVATRPLAAKANAGIPRVTGKETTWDVTPAQMAEAAKAYLALGARIVGGCCGTSAEHVRAIAGVVRR